MRSTLLAVIGFSVVLGGAPQALAQSAPSRRAEELSLQLTTLHAELGPDQQRAAHAAEMRRIALARRDVLRTLMDDEPAAVLRLALPEEALDAFPPEVRLHLEQRTVVRGVLHVLQEDDSRGGRRRYVVHTADRGPISIHFAKPAADLQSDDLVEVEGVLVAAALAAESGASVQQVSSVAPNTFGEQKTLMILVNFQDAPSQPYGVAEARELLFGTVNRWFRENSQEQVWFTGDVVGWFTIALDSSGCDSYGIQSRARTAASAAGIDLSRYRRFIYAFPQNACSWWGLGQIGGSTTHAWVNGTLALKVVAHELGHNFGLHHAAALECGGVAVASNCTQIEYGDPADVMGDINLFTNGHFNAFAKERLGWLNYGSSAPILTVNGPGTYFIDAYATNGTSPKALKVLREDSTTGQRRWYYVEYRRAVGFDSYLGSYSNIQNGVIVHTATEGAVLGAVLDLTPATSSWWDPALTTGETFVDPQTGLTFSTVSTTAEGASVDIHVTPPACVPSTPSVTITPNQTQWGAPGAWLRWTLSVKNNDSASCPTAGFNLASVAPAGWAAAASHQTFVLQPGQTAAATVDVASSTGAATGYYPVSVTVSSETAATADGSATMTYAVQSSYGLSLAATFSTLGKNRTITAVADVTAAGAGVSGVNVTFVFVKPDGKSFIGSATTDAAGQARYQMKSGAKDPPGVWSVAASASLNGVTSSATTIVVVK